MEQTCIHKYVSHTNTQENIDKYGTDMQTVISPFVMYYTTRYSICSSI